LTAANLPASHSHESALSEADLRARARAIKVVLSDNDGTLTDGTVYYSVRGEELKQYSLRDGMGIELLRHAGIETAIVTRERTEFAQRRGEKLKLPHVFIGIHDKALELPRILEAVGATHHQVAYIGDDVNDLPVMELIAPHGLTAAPADAVDAVKKKVHYVARLPGGAGGFRDFADWLLALRADADSGPDTGSGR
jgi:3-deoxy-D-manno-octulosonate 8-phosphate phosphatase (KDO 8-P phosphatase)